MKDSNSYTVILDFRVNGENHRIDIDPDEPLLWVLCVDVGDTGGSHPVPQPWRRASMQRDLVRP